MIISHFLVTKDVKMCYREYVSLLPFLSLLDCAETSQTHFPTLREGKMEKDDGKCLNCLKNIMYDMLSFLFQAELKVFVTKPALFIHDFPSRCCYDWSQADHFLLLLLLSICRRINTLRR